MTKVAAAVLIRTPVLGWALHDAISGLPDAKYYFIANVVVLLVAAVAIYGYPVLITLALTGVVLAFAALLAITSCGMFWGVAQVAREDGQKLPHRH